ncbi:hypothetical protein [Clostridium thermarum]|uniref:hypothetical protein n=1 Tax=Clostridium thermarum TaxID=1716543 RepID=UPI0013D48E45|nr:hypothetical protein [Clostridium thermarum]
MTASVDPEYSIKVERLKYILNYMKAYNEQIIKQKSKIDKDVEYSITHYNSDNAEQFNELMINTTMQENLNQRVKNLSKSLLKPYFARVDFREAGNETVQKLYIGKMSLLKDEDNEPLIIDWRAPIANLSCEVPATSHLLRQ